MDNILNNEKFLKLGIIIGAICIPYAFIEFQIYQFKQEIEELNKKVISVVQQIANIKIEESKIESIISYLKQLNQGMKNERSVVQGLTVNLRNQQKLINELVNQLNSNGYTSIMYKPLSIPELKDEDDVEDRLQDLRKKKKKNELEELGI
jgi:predicted RNase H-like nuclease (RuvC/YqgF family)